MRFGSCSVNINKAYSFFLKRLHKCKRFILKDQKSFAKIHVKYVIIAYG